MSLRVTATLRVTSLAAGLAFLLCWPGAAAAQTANGEGWRDIDLLDGRLTIAAPPGSKIAPADAASIMAAVPGEQMVTKLNVPTGSTGNDIVVYVHELFALFPRDPAAYFRENFPGGVIEDKDAPPRGETLDSGLTAYGALEGHRRHRSGNNVLADFLVAQADGTTQEIFIMTWDVGPEELARLSAVSSRMAASLRPGPRQGLTTGGRHLLATVSDGSGEARLEIELPDGYTFSRERGPDFSVFRIGKLAPLDAVKGGMGLYVGDYPSPFYAQQGLTSADMTKVPAQILQRDAAWLEHREANSAGGPDWLHREVVLPLRASGDGPMLHVFASAPDDGNSLPELSRIAEHGLQLTPP